MRRESPPLVPDADHTTHMVLCDFEQLGTAYVETGPEAADEESIVRRMLEGQYSKPIRVIAFNVAEGWSRDVSIDIAGKVAERARSEQRTIGGETQAFVENHLDEELEPELCS